MTETIDFIVKLQCITALVCVLFFLLWLAAQFAIEAFNYAVEFKKCLPVWRVMLLLRRENPDFFKTEFVEKLEEYQRKARLYDMMKDGE